NFAESESFLIFVKTSPSIQESITHKSPIYMKKWILLIVLLPLTCIAQTYKYLGVEDGLSNRRVYRIQKDRTGFMWFLTHEGIDRYNGKDFKNYKLMDDGTEVNSLLNLNWLYID